VRRAAHYRRLESKSPTLAGDFEMGRFAWGDKRATIAQAKTVRQHTAFAAALKAGD